MEDLDEGGWMVLNWTLRNTGVKQRRIRRLDRTECASVVREAKAKFKGL